MDDDLLIVIVVIVAAFLSLQKERIRQHNSILAGNLRYWEVIRHGNPQYFFNHCGMTKPVFLLLLRKLTSEMGQLCDGTKIDFRNLDFRFRLRSWHTSILIARTKTKITSPTWHAIWSRLIFSMEAYRKTSVILIQQREHFGCMSKENIGRGVSCGRSYESNCEKQ